MNPFLFALGSKPPWLVLLVSLTVSIFATVITGREADRASQETFERRLEKLAFDIFHHLDTYIGTLRAGVALFNASEQVSHDEWRGFITTLEVARRYPGIQGIGYAPMLAQAEVAAFEQSVATDGFTNFRITPAGKYDWRVPVYYLEPFDWRNQRAFGYDMYSEPVRREAIDRAMRTGEASASGIVRLVQETSEDVQVGFLVYLPVWEQGAAEGRMPKGFVYAPFRMKKLLQGILGDSYQDLLFTIEDLGDPSQALFRSEPHGAAGNHFSQKTLDFGGRSWRLSVRSTEAFDASVGGNSALLVLIAGLIDSLLLFLMALTLVRNRRIAQTHAVESSTQLALAQKYQQMADLAPTALLLVDGNGAIRLCNREAMALTGYGEKLPGCNVEQLLPQWRSVSAEQLAPARAPRSAGELQDGRLVTEWGQELPVDIRLKPLALGRDQFIVCALVDLRGPNRQAVLLRQKTAALEQFVYAVSHDLKSPLIAMAGLAELAAQTGAVLASEDASRLLERIRQNCRQMEGLLNDLLALSRVSHKTLPVEAFDVAALMAELCTLYRGRVEAVGGQLLCEVDAGRFQGYRTLVRQLVDNLMTNAIKYRSPDRPLVLRLMVSGTDELLLISVSDNGTGIALEDRERVFGLFVRAHQASEGSGVGLTICRSICERHHGDIRIENSDLGGLQVSARLYPVETLGPWDNRSPQPQAQDSTQY